MILYPNVATQLDLTTEYLSEESDGKTKSNKSNHNENIDLEKVQSENGSFDKSRNNTEDNVNYGYEKE